MVPKRGKGTENEAGNMSRVQSQTATVLARGRLQPSLAFHIHACKHSPALLTALINVRHLPETTNMEHCFAVLCNRFGWWLHGYLVVTTHLTEYFISVHFILCSLYLYLKRESQILPFCVHTSSESYFIPLLSVERTRKRHASLTIAVASLVSLSDFGFL